MRAKAPDSTGRRRVAPASGSPPRPAARRSTGRAVHIDRKDRGSPKVTAQFYALVVPGLEGIASEEIRRTGAEIVGTISRIDKRDGFVLFRTRDIAVVMKCGTIEDVFQIVLDSSTGGGRGAPNRLARQIERTSIERALVAHHALRPGKRGRSYRVVARVAGDQNFRRDELEKAFSKAVGSLLSKWVPAQEKAALELWVHVIGDRTIAGVRLSDDSLAGRRYKRAHLPASLKPTVARALVLMAEAKARYIVLDPMCGAGTILREAVDTVRGLTVIGGDAALEAVAAARENVGRTPGVFAWDTRRLPLRTASIDVLISNPPYGRQHAAEADVARLYRAAAREWARVLKVDARCVVLTGEPVKLVEALPKSLRVTARTRILLRGLPVTAFVIVRL